MLLVVLAAVVLVVDQVTKVLAVEFLTDAGYVPLLGEFFGLRLVYNPGAAFSFATGITWVLALITIGVVVVIARLAPKIASRPWAVVLGLLLGGALGNLIDRLFRAPGPLRGHVVDFLDYYTFFVGNVADIAIVVAALGMMWLTLRGVEITAEGVSEGSGEEPVATDHEPGPAR